jgi:integrase
MAKFGSLRKLPSGRWQARYTDHNTGRMISAPDTFRTKSDASAWLAARRADLDRGLITNDAAARLPLSAYWDDYLPSIEVRLRPSSVRDYSYSWSKWIKPRFGAVPVSKILPRDIDRWMADMQAKGMFAQKVRSAFGVLSRLLDRAVRDGAIPVNPASRRSDPLPRVRRVDRPVLTVAQVEDLVTHFEHEDDRVMVRLLAYGGLRIGEALALQRQDVDLKRGLLHVQRSVSDAGGVVRVNDTKTGRDRWVALPASLVAQLRDLLRDRPINTDALLFPNADGGYRRARVTDRHRRIKAVKAWNASRVDEEERLLDPIEVGFHDLRSVCASLLIDAGASPKDVQAHLGHASIQTTLEIYARVRPERSADLAQRLDALIDEGVKARPRRGESAEKV